MIYVNRHGADNSSKMVFITYNNGSQTTAMTMLYNGNVGIGTISPGTKLTVQTANDVNQALFSRDGTNGIFVMGNQAGASRNWQISANFITANTLQFTPSTADGGTTFTTPAMTILEGGNVGIGTSTPQNTLNVIGDANASLDVFARRTLNLTSGYLYATNGTFTSWANVVNGTMATWANVINGTVLQAETLWNNNYSTYLTKPTWAQVTNGTNVALITAANTFGDFNQTFDTSVLVVDATSNRVGINTTSPDSVLDVGGNVTVLECIVFNSGGRICSA